MKEDFKKALSSFATGICIVTYKTQKGTCGVTINAFSSLSLDPAKILFCIGNNSYCHNVITEVDAFAVSILNHDQKALAYQFAGNDRNNLENYIEEKNSIPSIKDALAVLYCEKSNIYKEGDHDIIIGNVTNIDINKKDQTPLLYFKSNIIDNFTYSV